MTDAATPPVRSTVREYYEAILVAVVFALFVRTFVVQAFKIPTGSMEDNLLVGDHILVDKVAYGLHSGRFWDALLPYRDVDRGDVVVFRYPVQPSRDFIKRCMALPGDVIEVRDKAVIVNQVPRVEDPPVFFKGAEEPFGYVPPEADRLEPFQVPERRLFMMGDNRDRSYDSRFWGPVPRDHVKGKALLIYWSFASDPQRKEILSMGEKLKILTDVVVHFFTKTRWRRTFVLVH